MPIIRETIPVGDRAITIETGRVARQAGGSVLMQLGDTVVLVTACASHSERPGIDFFPLTCEYLEKTFAAGKIPGGFFKREGRLRDEEILVARLMDRPIRPLFPKGFKNETQVVATVLSADKIHPSDVLAMTGSSVALTLSDIPFAGPVAGIRVSRIDGKFVAFPTFQEMEQSDLDLIVSVSKDAIVMVEGGANQIRESIIIDALMFAHQTAQPLLALQDKLREVGQPKRTVAPVVKDEKLAARVREISYEDAVAAERIPTKMERYGRIRELEGQIVEKLLPEFPDRAGEIRGAFDSMRKVIVRGRILDEGIRIDGRRSTDIRNITCEVGVLPRVHGSALFTRGETQTVVATTLGTSKDEQKIDNLMGERWKAFLLHYNFPPFCVGETKPLRGPSRREIGHGALAERALTRVIPGHDEFPYTIRVVSETLESNGSSSMATVCGGTLSLMDCGVPIKAPVGGVAMGLIKEGDRYAILSDILGDEDHLGDMDFKVCGTRDGVTAIQMDIKIAGLSREILEKALAQARDARLYVLERMLATLPTYREELSQYAPRITTLKVKPDQIRLIIGSGGKTIKGIVDQTGVTIDVEDDGTVAIASSDAAAVKKAIDIIKGLTAEAEVGKTYSGTVRRIVDFGAFVEIFPGTDGLLHVSEMAHTRVANVTDLFKEGDTVEVKVVNVDRDGKVRLSRKDLLPPPTEEEMAAAAAARAAGGDRPPRREGGRDRGGRGGDRDRGDRRPRRS